MTLTLPRVLQRPSPNYTPSLIQHSNFFFHMMEGGYAGSTAWLCSTVARASATWTMSEDGSEVSQLVPCQYKAWAQCAFNGLGCSLEIPGRTAEGIPDSRWEAAAKIAAWYCMAYQVPPIWAKGGQGPGLCQHHDLGVAGGGHVDCSEIGSNIWLNAVALTQRFCDEFKKQGDLPAWALHSLPNPHQAKMPPGATPTPSHGGLDRSTPGELPLPHQTTSGYPHGSVADLQWRLNRIGGASALAVDGIAGSATRGAVARFQAIHGLYVDGQMGPKTWAVLDKESA